MSVLKQERTGQVNSSQLTREEKTKVIEKLTTARVGLLLRHPFFGNMATRLTLVNATDWCATLATDGRNFYYNENFVHSLTVKECEFGFGHEVLHNIFDHIGRRGDRDPQLANIAADYAANQILKDESIGQIPSSIKIFQDNKYRSWSFEQIYEHLYENAEKINVQDLGSLLDEHLDECDGKDGRPKLSEEEKKQIRDEVKEAMISSAQSAGAGKIPAGIARMITDLTEPKMNWREMLRMNIQSILKNNFSFSRPNRKSQMSGAVLPGLINVDTVDVCCGIDMSGSISDAQAKDFISEIKGIMDEFDDFNLQIWCFDTKVYNHKVFNPENSAELSEYRLTGGGGTDFECNWEFMKENNLEPKRFIMFTDMYPCGSWGDANYCDTLFVAHGTTTIEAPFGQTVYYNNR